MLTPRERSELAADICQRVIDAMKAQAGQPTLVDAHGLAHAIGVSVSSIDRWTAQGKLPVKLRLGNIRRYAIDEAIASLSKHEKVEVA